MLFSSYCVKGVLWGGGGVGSSDDLAEWGWDTDMSLCTLDPVNVDWHLWFDINHHVTVTGVHLHWNQFLLLNRDHHFWKRHLSEWSFLVTYSADGQDWDIDILKSATVTDMMHHRNQSLLSAQCDNDSVGNVMLIPFDSVLQGVMITYQFMLVNKSDYEVLTGMVLYV